MIANAKVHAIRDAQVMEKSLIGKEMKEEEMRLDTMMEIDRINAIRAAEDIDELKQKQRFLWVFIDVFYYVCIHVLATLIQTNTKNLVKIHLFY